jgi:hypothetical protein
MNYRARGYCSFASAFSLITLDLLYVIPLGCYVRWLDSIDPLTPRAMRVFAIQTAINFRMGYEVLPSLKFQLSEKLPSRNLVRQPKNCRVAYLIPHVVQPPAFVKSCATSNFPCVGN